MRQLIYHSAVRGSGEDLSAEPKYPYFGLVRRVPKGADITAAMYADLEELTKPRRVHGWLGEPVPGQPFERTEVFDMESEETLVMYRVPFRPVEPAEAPPMSS